MQNYMPNRQIPYQNQSNNMAPPPYIPPLQSPVPQSAPSYAGVNIQIINPMVNPTNGAIYPTQTGSAYEAGTNGGCYPSSYYTTQPGTWGGYPQAGAYNQPVINQPQQQPSGFYDSTGKYHPYVQNQNGQVGYIDDSGQFRPLNSVNSPIGENTSAQPASTQQGDEKSSSANGSDNTGAANTAGASTASASKEADKGDTKSTNESGDKNSSDDVKNAGNENSKSGDVNSDKNTDATDKNANVNDGEKNSETTGDNAAANSEDKNANSNADDVNSDNKNSDDKDKSSNDNTVNSDGQNQDNNSGVNQSDKDAYQNSQDNSNVKESEKSTEKTSEKSSEKTSEQSSESTESAESTKKVKVVALSNEYIKTLENYLNSQDLEIRKMGAHEVVDRILEDPSRKDDPALTALVNKMLQDPSSVIRAIGLSIIESRSLEGDDLTVKILKKMQNANDGFGLDATQATSALLKMAGKTVEKEVPVTEAEKKSSAKQEESSSRPKMPFFNNEAEKYEWFMKNGCRTPAETKWVAEYVKKNNNAEGDK